MPPSHVTALVDHLERSGIETRHLLPLINQPVYRRLFGDLDARLSDRRATERNGLLRRLPAGALER